MKLNPILSALMLGSALLASHGAALAQPKPIELRYTSGAPPKGNPWVMQIERFAKDVDEESKGEIKIAPFFASQLGSEQDTVQQVARGRIDMGGFSAGSAALVVPEIALLADAILLPQRRRAGLRARQPHDQAGDRSLRQEGRAVPGLELEVGSDRPVTARSPSWRRRT